MHALKRIASLMVLSTALVAQERPTLAVLDFDGYGISEPEVAALINRLRTNMTQLDQYRIIERGLMIDILREQDFQMSGCTSDECAVEVGQLLGAQFMLSGSIGKVGMTWTIEMRIIDVETGEAVRSASYDTQGTIDVVLTEGMSSAARRISGVAIADAAPATVGFTIRPALLSVSVEPGQGIIFVDDIDRGAGQVSGLELAPGSHKVTARLDRYHTIDTTLSLEAGERSDLTLALLPMNGYLAFTGDAGARVKIGGRTMAMTPTDNILLQMGTYPIAISKPTYYTFRANPTVLYDHITTVDFVLNPKPKLPAVLFSTVLPGSGQLYHSQKRGAIFLLAAAGLAVLGYSQEVALQAFQEDYNGYLQEYNSETDITAALAKKGQVQDSFDAMKTAEQQRNILFGALGGVWAINFLDIIF